MFGLDQALGGLVDGAPVALVVAVAVLLGLRHATDPDHLAAVTSLIAGDNDRSVRNAGLLGAFWGLGHATTLALFGLPIVLFQAYLPQLVVEGAEVAIGLVICALAVRLLWRWQRGVFHVHTHVHADGTAHRHVHSHREQAMHEHEHVRARSPLASYAIGLLHGVGGSAGVGVLLLATIPDRAVAAACLVVFAASTAVSMAVLSTAIGHALTSRRLDGAFGRVAPALGVSALGFGAWYLTATLAAV